MLMTPVQIAKEVFGLTDAKEIRSRAVAVWRMAARGQIPCVRVGNRIYLDPEDFKTKIHKLEKPKKKGKLRPFFVVEK